MIRVADGPHATLTFAKAEVGLNADAAYRASRNLGAALLEQTEAAVAVDKARFRLEKATSSLEECSVAYLGSITKGAWNKDELRKAYNNALAGHRDADAAFVQATDAARLADSVVEALTEIASGNFVSKSTRDDEDDDEKRDDSSEDDKDFEDNFEKAEGMLILCPVCFGGDSSCKVHDADGMVPDSMLEADGSDDDDSSASGFTTKSLLAYSFERTDSNAEIDAILKGGPGSGAQAGHPFYGNGHAGGMRNHPRLGVQRGWKQTVKLYEAAAKAHTDAAKAHEAVARSHEALGHKAQAAASFRAAYASHMSAQGAHQGIAATHTFEVARGSNGASADRASAAKSDAAQSRAAAANMKAEADRVEGAAAANG